MHIYVYLYTILACLIVSGDYNWMTESSVYGQTDRQPDFLEGWYLSRWSFFVREIYVIPNFVKIVRPILDIYNSCSHGQTDRQSTRFFTRLRPI